MASCGLRPITNYKINHQLRIICDMNYMQDPLLGLGSQYPPANQMQAENEEFAKKLAQLQQQRAAINMQAQPSQTPLWDEIDKIEDGLTSVHRQILNQNEEYVESYH